MSRFLRLAAAARPAAQLTACAAGLAAAAFSSTHAAGPPAQCEDLPEMPVLAGGKGATSGRDAAAAADAASPEGAAGFGDGADGGDGDGDFAPEEFAGGPPPVGPYETMTAACANLLNPPTFQGAHVEVRKQLTGEFQISHKVDLGAEAPQGAPTEKYEFSATLAAGGILGIAGVDSGGSVVAQAVIDPPGGGLGCVLVARLAGDGSGQDMYMADLKYSARDASAGLRYGLNQAAMGPSLGMNYHQQVTPQVTLGTDATYLHSADAVKVSCGGKYDTPEYAVVAQLTKEPVPGGGGSAIVFNPQYVRKVSPDRVQVGTEMQLNLLNPPQSTFGAGAQFNLKGSNLSLAVDQTGKCSTVLESKFGAGSMLLLSGQVGIGQKEGGGDSYKFGFGVNIGIQG